MANDGASKTNPNKYHSILIAVLRLERDDGITIFDADGSGSHAARLGCGDKFFARSRRSEV